MLELLLILAFAPLGRSGRNILTNQSTPKKNFQFPQVALLALLMVCAVDIWLGLTHPLTKAVTPNLDRSETFSTACVYNEQQQAPDVVLLGSSLMVAPVMQAEALFLGRPFPRFEHRQSTFVSDLLSKSLGTNPNVFCFAVAGEAVSDAYLITKHVLTGDKKPKAIVYGLAPRDFQDNTCPGIDSTEAFNVLSDLRDVKEVASDNNFAFDRTANLALARISSLWKYRNDIRSYATLRLKKSMERVLPWVVFDKYDQYGNLGPHKKGQYPEEAIGKIQAFPNVAMENAGNIKTIQQYIRRYRPENKSAVDQQFEHLNKLIELCRDNQIELLLVNMPLSKTNIDLLPDGFYKNYIDRLQKMCAQNNTQLLDLSALYNGEESYTDTVHLKPEVSKEFLSTLVSEMSRSRAISAVKKTGVSLIKTQNAI